MPASAIPMVFYGTITGPRRSPNGESEKCLSFLAAAPLTIVPMKSEAFTVLSDSMDESDIKRAIDESVEIYRIFSKLIQTTGLTRLWATPSGLIAQGDAARFETIAAKIRAVMEEVLGEISFYEVPHDEARPLFFPIGS